MIRHVAGRIYDVIPGKRFMLAHRAGADKSTVSRLLDVLRHAGYVRRDEVRGAYTLSLRFLELAEAARAGLDLRRVAEPHLHRLWTRTRGTVALRVLDGTELVTVAILESPDPVRVSHPPGGRVPYNFGAYGKAVLAAMDDVEVGQLLRARPPHRFSPRTLVARDALIEAIREVRRTGWAVSDEEGLSGARAVAAPVSRAGHRTVGALGVSFPVQAMSLADLRRLGPTVQATARHLSEALGATPGAVPGIRAPGVRRTRPSPTRRA